MQLLMELLDRNHDRLLLEELLDDLALFEDLGNLKAIDKNFMKLLKTKVFVTDRGSSKSGHDERRDSWDDKNKSSQLRGGLGENSDIEEVNIKASGEMIDPLSKSENVLTILKYDSKQVLAIVRVAQATTSYRNASKAKFKIVASKELFGKILTPEEYEKYAPKKEKGTHPNFRGRSYKNSDFTVDKLTGGLESDVVGKLRDVINLVLKKAKTEKKEVKLLIVKADKKRAEKSGERVKARAGTKPYQTGNDVATSSGKKTYDSLMSNYVKELRSEIRSRLEKFKAGKAEGAKTPEELLKMVLEKGFPEKIKLGDFVYKLYRMDNMRLDNLKDQASGKKLSEYDIPCIEYQHDGNDPALAKVHADLEKIKKQHDFNDEEARNKYYELREKLLPSRELKIAMGFKGGSIVPMGIQLGRDKAWIF